MLFPRQKIKVAYILRWYAVSKTKNKSSVTSWDDMLFPRQKNKSSVTSWDDMLFPRQKIKVA